MTDIYSPNGELRHKVYYDEKYGVARIEHYEVIDVDDARKIVAVLEKILEDKEPKLLLDDSTQVSAATMDKETRKVFDEAGKRIELNRVAVFGADPMTRMMSKIVFTIAGKIDSTKFFKTESQALAWLKGEEK